MNLNFLAQSGRIIVLVAAVLLSGFVGCQPSTSTTLPNAGTGSLGGTSSGGPPAVPFFYVHCVNADESLSVDATGNTGYVGGSAPGEMPTLEGEGHIKIGRNPCSDTTEAWAKVTARPSYPNKSVVITIDPTGPSPITIDTGSWANSGEASHVQSTYSGEALVCDLFVPANVSVSCPIDAKVLFSCSSLNVKVCAHL